MMELGRFTSNARETMHPTTPVKYWGASESLNKNGPTILLWFFPIRIICRFEQSEILPHSNTKENSCTSDRLFGLASNISGK